MDYLVHHGIKGQKWGVRRFQDETGAYTAAGRERYGIGGSDSEGRERYGIRGSSAEGGSQFVKKGDKSSQSSAPEKMSDADKERFRKEDNVGFVDKAYDIGGESANDREYQTKMEKLTQDYVSDLFKSTKDENERLDHLTKLSQNLSGGIYDVPSFLIVRKDGKVLNAYDGVTSLAHEMVKAGTPGVNYTEQTVKFPGRSVFSKPLTKTLKDYHYGLDAINNYYGLKPGSAYYFIWGDRLDDNWRH